MIRINLLGTPKPKGKRGGVVVPDIQVGVGISPLFKAVAVVAVVALLNAGYWYRLDKEKHRIAEQMAPLFARTRSCHRSRPVTWSASARLKCTSAAWT